MTEKIDRDMKTILITGGTNGLGRGLATHYLKTGERVIAIGSSVNNGKIFLDEANEIGAEERAVFIQANLNLVSETKRIIEEVKNQFPVLDTLIFCATKHNNEYIETSEGFESSFALDYLSRFNLSYGLKESLEKADSPIILNICGSGMNGDVNWEDLQHKKQFEPMKVMMHGSRLNDLLGVGFAEKNPNSKIKYILYNPMAVKTPGMANTGSFMMKLMFKLIAKPVDKAIVPIIDLLSNPPAQPITSFTQRKENSLTKETFDKTNSLRLYQVTSDLLNRI